MVNRGRWAPIACRETHVVWSWYMPKKASAAKVDEPADVAMWRISQDLSETYVRMYTCSPCNHRLSAQNKGLVTLPSGARQR